MKKIILILSFLVLNYSYANEAVTTMSDYVQAASNELAASPPLKMLVNKEGESRHEVTMGYLMTSTDDNATVTGGATSYEKGDANGYGAGYGYSNSFKEKWAFYFWGQIATQSGDHTQTIAGVTTNTVSNFSATTFQLSTGISYEWLRDTEKQTLNTFLGISVIHLEVSGDIKTFNPTGGAQTAAYKGSLDGFFPAINFGVNYRYDFFENFEIIPYAVALISIADDCHTYRVDDVTQTDGNIQENSPSCGVNTSGGDGETDIETSIATFGFNFNYKPWDLSLNVSGFIRDALLRDDNEERAPVKATYISFAKSF